MIRYDIRQTRADVPVDGALAMRAWASADRACIDQYPWRGPLDPAPPQAEVRLLYSSEALYVRFHVRERTVVARNLEYQSSVCRDSCVEFFVSPGCGAEYLNFEVNCIGTLLLSRCGPNRQFSPVAAEEAETIRIATSLPKGQAIPSPVPGPAEGYVVEYAIPFAFVAAQTGCSSPRPGTIWRANFYRCCDGGPEPSWGTWSPVGTPSPDFHRPEYFGELRFA